jgi:hypothetical protein
LTAPASAFLSRSRWAQRSSIFACILARSNSAAAVEIPARRSRRCATTAPPRSNERPPGRVATRIAPSAE